MRALISLSPDTPIAEAREARAYWRRRATQLPRYRHAERREARALAGRWRERLVQARLERLRLAWLAPAVAPLTRTRAEHARRVGARFIRRRGLARRLLLTAAVAAFGSLAALAMLALLVGHIVAHLL